MTSIIVNGTGSVDVTTQVTNISANNVTVYVDGDYNSQYLFNPHITELHMLNNEVGALWNPALAEIPSTLRASVMKQAKISILYDGWIDLESTGPKKPYGARRYGEVLGYDIYARLGEQYVSTGSGKYNYSLNGGYFTEDEPVNYTWSIMNIYRALGLEQVHFYAQTEKVPSGYDINESPIIQALTMPMSAPYLEDGITKVAATRTAVDDYITMARKDGLGALVEADREKQYVTVAEFCTLASELMHIYGEPVLTDQETYMLLETYGRKLPYGLPYNQLEAIKYLLARGVIEADMEWRSDITFEEAATILMRIKDTGSRLTFKEIQLTTDVGLLSKGYYPTKVSAYQAPITIVDEAQAYTEYTEYDYFVQCVDNLEFRSASGFFSTPFICAGDDNGKGVLDGTEYAGRVMLGNNEFYHFRVLQTLDSIARGGSVYINTAIDADTPYMYALPVPLKSGNPGGVYLYKGDKNYPTDGVIRDWEWVPLDNDFVPVPSEYCDYARKATAAKTAMTQTALFNSSSYGFTIRVYNDDCGKITFTDTGGNTKKLSDVTTVPIKLKNGMSITREYSGSAGTKYVFFVVKGCSNKNTLTEIFTCEPGSAFQSFSAFSKNNDQYLVSIDYLKAIGAVWEFTKTSDSAYYIGVKSLDAVQYDAQTVSPSAYTDVFIGTSGTASYVIRGSQMTIYPADTAVVWESDTGYYVDYSAILGISRAVSFENTNGTVSLSESNQLSGVHMQLIPNVNNVDGSRKPTYEWLPIVYVQDSKGNSEPYIYTPITYALANWLVVDNRIDMTTGVFSFFASRDPVISNEGTKALRDYLGVETNGVNWSVNYKGGAALVNMQVEHDAAVYKLGDQVDFTDLLYVEDLNAYLVRPNKLEEAVTYGDFVTDHTNHVTSIIYKGASQFADWNNNIYKVKENWDLDSAIHRNDLKYNTLCDVAGWKALKNEEFPACSHSVSKYWDDWIPAPVGVPGLLGYPASTSRSLAYRESVATYSGVAYVVRNGVGAVITVHQDGSASEDTLKYSIIHATPTKAWIQSCGFTFTFLAGSPLAESTPNRPVLEKGGATAGFDWEQFFKDIGLQNADDWLTIGIIAVLNILPRIFMFAFILLMGLALIADVKPWQIFCDSVIDPYKLLTLGRKDVHTIQLKMVFLYSIIALALFGMFQNGLILNVIAWIARAITGILRR